MSVIDDIKELIARSRLFVNAEKLKSVGKMKKIGKRSKGIVKIGQGGTLDPLADGVLGRLILLWPLTKLELTLRQS